MPAPHSGNIPIMHRPHAQLAPLHQNDCLSMQSLVGEHVSRGAPDETVLPSDYWNAKAGKYGVYAIFLALLAKLVQAEAAVERGYWAQKRLMNPLRSRLKNDSIRDEMRILLNGGPLPGIAFAGMQLVPL